MLGTRVDMAGWRIGLQTEFLRMREVPKDLGKRIAEAAGLAVLLHQEAAGEKARAAAARGQAPQAGVSPQSKFEVQAYILPGLIGDILGERQVA
jgi:hypothetical protein